MSDQEVILALFEIKFNSFSKATPEGILDNYHYFLSKMNTPCKKTAVFLTSKLYRWNLTHQELLDDYKIFKENLIKS